MLLLSSLFVFLGMGTVQPVANVPVQVTEHVSSTRYQFAYQENEHIIDLNAKRKILAYYIANELQNPSLLPSTQKELLQYDEKSKWDLAKTFDAIPSGLSRPWEMTTGQPVANISVQVTEHVSSTRYQFEYQENEHIIDLNAERKILAYYIDNKLQNPSFLALIQKKLLQYDEKSKGNLSETFNHSPRRTRRAHEAQRAAAYRKRNKLVKTGGGKGRSSGRGGRRRVQGGIWVKKQEKTRIERKNNPSVKIKINRNYLGDRFLDVGSMLAETGFPPTQAFGLGAIIIGSILGLSDYFFPSN